jgi:VanZ family protein
MTIKSVIFDFWKSILVTCVVMYLSLVSSKTFSNIPTFNHEDYLIHFLMYLGLTSTLMYDARLHSLDSFKPTTNFFCVIFPFTLGGMLEVFQPIVSNRTASWMDFLFNSLGVLIALSFFTYLRNLPSSK